MDKQERDYKYYKKIFSDTPKPFAFVDLDLFEENARQLKKRAKGKKVRLASKSIRCRILLRSLLETHEQFQGVMSFYPEEAVFLSENGFDDILIGYPIWCSRHIRMVGREVKKGKQLILMVDSPKHIEQIAQVAEELGVEIPVCLDVDMSSSYPFLHFGVLRSGVQTVRQALEVYRAIQQTEFVRLEGVMGYEAQIAGLGDNVPGKTLKNSVVRMLKGLSTKEIAKRRAEVVKALVDKGANLQIVNGGGTGSLETTAKESVVTEVTIGSGFYSSGLFDNYTNFKHLPALGFALEVVRKPKPNVYTCLGGGYIASGQVGIDKQPLPYLPKGFKLTTNEGVGEVQTPIIYKGDEQIDYGDPIFFRHSKAGELCERFNTLYLVKGGKVVDVLPTYRGEGQCFI